MDPNGDIHERADPDIVARALALLGSGFRTMDEVHEKYQELAGQKHWAALQRVTATVTRLNAGRSMHQRRRGWWINLDRLAERWPRLPWNEGVTVKCQEDAWAEMPPGHVPSTS